MDMMKCAAIGQKAAEMKTEMLARAKSRIVELEGRLSDAGTDRRDIRKIANELTDLYKLVAYFEGGTK